MLFFFLSKLLDVALSPLSWAMILIVLTVLAARRGKKKRATIMGASAIGVAWLFAIEPVSNALVRSLESTSAMTTMTTIKADVTYDVVIVLGGMVDDEASAAWNTPAYADSVDRLLVAYDLLRADRARFALITGGSPRDARHPDWNEARVLERQLAAWGVAKERLVVDEASLNTRQNAVESARIARERGWSKLVLVTSAAHMPRAAGCFRAAGVTFDTVATDYHSHALTLRGSWLPRAGDLAMSTGAIREHAGRIVYRVMGYSAAWP